MTDVKRIRALDSSDELLSGIRSGTVVIFNGGGKPRAQHASVGVALHPIQPTLGTEPFGGTVHIHAGNPGAEGAEGRPGGWTWVLDETDCTQMIKLFVGLRKKLTAQRLREEGARVAEALRKENAKKS